MLSSPRRRLNLSAQRFGDAGLLAMPERVRLTVLLHLIAFPFRALGQDHQDVVAGSRLRFVHQSRSISLSRLTVVLRNAAADGGDDTPYRARCSPHRGRKRERCRRVRASPRWSVGGWIASIARVIAVEKPMQYSVLRTSLSMVFGIAMTFTPSLSSVPRSSACRRRRWRSGSRA